MPVYEYKVVPAPRKGKRAKGARGTEGKFAHALQEMMNEYGLQGWEYQRTDTLPCEERSGLTGRTTVFQNMLVFRRAVDEAEEPVLIEDKSDEPVEKALETEDTSPRLGGATRAPEPMAEPAPAGAATV